MNIYNTNLSRISCHLIFMIWLEHLLSITRNLLVNFQVSLLYNSVDRSLLLKMRSFEPRVFVRISTGFSTSQELDKSFDSGSNITYYSSTSSIILLFCSLYCESSLMSFFFFAFNLSPTYFTSRRRCLNFPPMYV